MQILPPPCAAPYALATAKCWGAKRAAKCFAGCLFALWLHGALAASAVDVQTSRQGDLIEVRAKATIKAHMEVVWATLTDYERLPEFIPGLKKSRITARNGATITIEQSGEAHFLFITVPIEVTLESTERAPHSIEVRRVAGTLRQLQGRYETEAMPDHSYVQLRWTGSIEPENRLPPLVGESIMRQSIRSQFTGMVREIERREAARKRPTPASLPPNAAPPAPPPSPLATPAAEPNASSPAAAPASTSAQPPSNQ
jgi:ribosome-associated toxin RatA of RatAB toxin-antitoxin module